MSISKLLTAAELRIKTANIPGVGPVRIREPSYALMTEFRELTAAGHTRQATAKLFAGCVMEGDMAMSEEDAYKIVDGSSRIINPVMTAIIDNLAENVKNV